VIQTNPRDASAYASRGAAYLRKGDNSGAVVDYTRAIEIDPRFARAYRDRGLTYERMGNRNDAAADYRRALELNPNDGYSRDALKRLGATP
jgi:Flp pilus assembly protein TadD